MKRKKDTAVVNFETVCEIARTLPGAEESTSYGTPAFKVKGKLFARFIRMASRWSSALTSKNVKR